MSAERNTSNGAPFLICARKLPEEPVVGFSSTSGWALAKAASRSCRHRVRSAAAAMFRVSPACAAPRHSTPASNSSNFLMGFLNAGFDIFPRI
jgi:hypothetical protein